MRVLVLVTDRTRLLTRTTRELLGAAAQLVRLGEGRLAAAAFGSQAAALAKALAEAGVEVAYAAAHQWLDGRWPEADLEAFLAAVVAAEATHVIVPADATGRDVAPRLAWRAGMGVVTQVTGFDRVDGQLVATRPVYGGRATAVLALPPRVVATIRERAFPPATLSGRGAVVYLDHSPPPGADSVELVERIREEDGGVDLEEARVVVSGGRGVGGPEGFAMLADLARLLDGAVGGSRAATDAGWLPPSCQIGLTGRSVAPELYIAVGISGASQHLAGVKAARTIVAINIDSTAPIFSAADIGVVGDWRPVVEALIAELRARDDASGR
ncbi:MAG: electron transfer flavoprotein subunit alpha/FixB family protein [Armatimonadota bacterium]|nr:electron transfer flavoprotein subunit alpha/FixB family protein [Armatimonadota bacterium]MDR7426181.1 electron transfer flavoprotein subunit alpha/FixB family protein [Armatimonadota bacterium]MDR7464744.1 electron transfer flavoprotein subunit alpha/FixB family protein [Armatimonadota bacterium]MDR7469042.1 electron transfer flavoprotein subunit alpha/FixB family protein [Armatimonadota bacterium]MDR7475619.1 electron transfer flavoprotein subunit alpha/FixB family protein [Armatimonadota